MGEQGWLVWQCWGSLRSKTHSPPIPGIPSHSTSNTRAGRALFMLLLGWPSPELGGIQGFLPDGDDSVVPDRASASYLILLILL